MNLKHFIELLKKISAEPSIGESLQKAIADGNKDEVSKILAGYDLSNEEIDLIMENASILTSMRWGEDQSTRTTY